MGENADQSMRGKNVLFITTKVKVSVLKTPIPVKYQSRHNLLYKGTKFGCFCFSQADYLQKAKPPFFFFLNSSAFPHFFCPSTPLAKVVSELNFQPSRHMRYISLHLAAHPGPNRVVRVQCELQWPRLLSPSPHCLCVPSPLLL